MKTKKIYWRLAFLLSLIMAITWCSVFAATGELPTIKMNLDIWLVPYINSLPSWAFNRWLDIPGMFILVFIIHNAPSKVKILWDDWDEKKQKYYIEWLLIMIIIVATIIAILASFILTNLLVGLFPFIIGTTILTCIFWSISSIAKYDKGKIKVKEMIDWIMQK